MDRSFQIDALVRKNIADLVPYSSARDEFSGSASVFLDANENPYNRPWNRYPDPRQRKLKKVIAGLKSQHPENLFLGNGSDEGIDLLFRVFCEPGEDNVITVDPTYGMYGVCAAIHHTGRKSVMLREDFNLDPEAVLRAADHKTKLIFLCSPNNPTANSFDQDSVIRIVDEVDCLVVVDEAYIDFSRGPGLLEKVPQKENLVILQTLSKAWGLAGIRLGMVFAHPLVTGYLSRVKYPYNINALTIKQALKSLGNPDRMKERVKQILRERNRMVRWLGSYSFVEKVYPSDANFLLVKTDNPKRIHAFLMKHGIIVRDRSTVPLCTGCLRITVGTAKENRILLNALKSYEQNPDIRSTVI